VKCAHCGAGFNRVTGRSNTVPILLYQLIGLPILIAVLVLFFLFR
jgi:hypothetical protein